MPTEPQLLAAVLQNPDSDPPRIAYADWCGAQPDPSIKARGEFIKAQVRLAAIAATGTHEELHTLRYRVMDLREAHARTWDRPLAAIASVMGYDRGFVELLSTTAGIFLDRAPEIFVLAPVRHLDLQGVVPAAEKLFTSPHLATIRSLRMDDCGLTDRHMELLAACEHATSLRWLSLDRNALTLDGADAIARSPYLKKLAYASFTGNPVDPTAGCSTDGDLVITESLPDSGKSLERRHGMLPWLHRVGPLIADLVPDRFRLWP